IFQAGRGFLFPLLSLSSPLLLYHIYIKKAQLLLDFFDRLKGGQSPPFLTNVANKRKSGG
ncbi:hypothetical protein, partial [Pseudoruminococcus massiliensis]|uniref:hypothetical protein n=1 Tax=Pseudoruminococcus massiliensis TaxID=2086583 RepID=UPI003AB66B02